MGKHVFEIHNEQDCYLYLAWVLNITDEGFKKDKEIHINNDKSFKILWEIFAQLGDITVVTEENYVDRVYRDSYYFYYSCKHFNYSRYCRRITLFKGFFKNNAYFSDIPDEELKSLFVGSIVIRPIKKHSIGRTLLNPQMLMKTNCYIRLTNYSMTVYGRQLDVKAFPYSMQDGETTSCAEITILNLLDYYSKTYPEYRSILPSEINKIAEISSYERRIPTTGLRYELLSKIFCEVGFYPRLYSSEKMDKNKFKRIMHYYIESGIPIALGMEIDGHSRHSVVGIGHGPLKTKLFRQKQYAFIDSENLEQATTLWLSDTADMVDTYCIMDDNLSPYTLCECLEREKTVLDVKEKILELNGYKVEYIMVPLYKRMFLEAADAYDICTSILASSRLGIKKVIENIGIKDNPIIIRLFMTSSGSFQKYRHRHFDNCKVIRDKYNETIFPRFIWVCELYRPEDYPEKVIGEIIIDATSSADAATNSFIIINYPKKICIRKPESLQKNEDMVFESIEDWNSFAPFEGNLSPFN